MSNMMTFVVDKSIDSGVAAKIAGEKCPHGWKWFRIWEGTNKNIAIANRLLQGAEENAHCFYFVDPQEERKES